jgi:regulator of protease activity HflC (stomatin/prohibitin superfamily)
LQQLSFRADQVTAEKVGVEVVGLAVYRIADPLIAYRVLNFAFPERAQQKLEETLTQMFVGATRRLVANLPVEDCLKKRKSALAAELLREIAPVVGGEGALRDGTDKGWGVVIDTIEIQEVRVLSAQVFTAMQAPFRSDLERSARQARAESQRDIAAREEECSKSVEEAKIKSKLWRLDANANVDSHSRALQQQAEQAEADAKLRSLERAAHAARAEVGHHDILQQAAERFALRSQREFDLALARQEAEAQLDARTGRARAEVALLAAGAERESAEADARRITAQNLPALAAAVGQRFESVRVTHIGGDPGAAFGSIAQAVQSVLTLAKDAQS